MDYYTAEEAMKKLNKPRSTFFREVEDRKIPYELEEGRKRGRKYPKEAIDILARRQKTKLRRSEPPYLIFSPSQPADLWMQGQIAKGIYGTSNVLSYEELLERFEKNESMFMSVREMGRVVGYAAIQPLEEGVILSVLRGEIQERNIPLSAIQPWTDRTPFVLLTATIKKSEEPTRTRVIGSFMIRNTLKWMLSLQQEHRIKRWYVLSSTKSGQRVLERLGFHELTAFDDGKRKGYVLEDLSRQTGLIARMAKSLARQEAAKEAAMAVEEE
jgi:hypothetical protein